MNPSEELAERIAKRWDDGWFNEEPGIASDSRYAELAADVALRYFQEQLQPLSKAKSRMVATSLPEVTVFNEAKLVDHQNAQRDVIRAAVALLTSFPGGDAKWEDG